MILSNPLIRRFTNLKIIPVGNSLTYGSYLVSLELNNRIENKYNNFSANITIPGLVQNARAKIVNILNSEDQVFCVNIKYFSNHRI